MLLIAIGLIFGCVPFRLGPVCQPHDMAPGEGGLACMLT